MEIPDDVSDEGLSLPARRAWIEAVVEAKILLLCQKLDNFHRKG